VVFDRRDGKYCSIGTVLAQAGFSGSWLVCSRFRSGFSAQQHPHCSRYRDWANSCERPNRIATSTKNLDPVPGAVIRRG
jgi:hypothetical protein